MISLERLSTFRLEVDWLMTWFPTRDGSPFEAQKTRAGVIWYQNSDPAIRPPFA